MEKSMEIEEHKTPLEGLMPKNGEYPVALRRAERLLVAEQPNLVPIYGGSHYMTFAEARVMAQEGDEFMQRMEKERINDELERMSKNISQLVYGMKEYGTRGYPDLMVLTQDLHSKNPAVRNPNLPPFSFEIEPKTFDLGLTGRTLEDQTGKRYAERLFIGLDMYDAYDFMVEIMPKKIVAIMPDKSGIVIYENGKEIGDKERVASGGKKKHYVFEDETRKRFNCETEILPTEGLRVVQSDFLHNVGRYKDGTILFGHRFGDIKKFLDFATKHSDHLIWKICRSEMNDPNAPLIDAGPVYGKYRGQTRWEHENRLHFMPDKASLYFDGTMISFDKPRGLQALVDLGDFVRDIWIDPSYLGEGFCEGWDVVLDRSREVTPNKPVRLNGRGDFRKWAVKFN